MPRSPSASQGSVNTPGPTPSQNLHADPKGTKSFSMNDLVMRVSISEPQIKHLLSLPLASFIKDRVFLVFLL